MLFEFITLNRDEIITRCRAKVATRSIPPPSEAEMNHGVPLFLDQLVEMLESGGSTLEIDRSAGQHGHDLLLKGFTERADQHGRLSDPQPMPGRGHRERRHDVHARKSTIAVGQSHDP
jgi:hypothetical protein